MKIHSLEKDIAHITKVD